MNIIIAGIVSVIMLLVGGTKFYNQYIPGQQHLQQLVQEQEQEQLQREWLRQRQEQQRQLQQRTQAFLSTLPRCDDVRKNFYKRYHLIKTEDELVGLMLTCPQEIGHCKIQMSQDLEEPRVRLILHERGCNPNQIFLLAKNFIRE